MITEGEVVKVLEETSILLNKLQHMREQLEHTYDTTFKSIVRELQRIFGSDWENWEPDSEMLTRYVEQIHPTFQTSDRSLLFPRTGIVLSTLLNDDYPLDICHYAVETCLWHEDQKHYGIERLVWKPVNLPDEVTLESAIEAYSAFLGFSNDCSTHALKSVKGNHLIELIHTFQMDDE